MTNTTAIKRKSLKSINHNHTFKRAIARLFEAIGTSIKQTPIALCVIFNIWGILSGIEIILNNGIGNYTYWSYNVFKILSNL